MHIHVRLDPETQQDLEWLIAHYRDQPQLAEPTVSLIVRLAIRQLADTERNP